MTTSFVLEIDTSLVTKATKKTFITVILGSRSVPSGGKHKVNGVFNWYQIANEFRPRPDNAQKPFAYSGNDSCKRTSS